MPIRVVTKEVRYIHELSLTLEHSMPVSSPAVPGLTAGASFLVQTVSGIREGNEVQVVDESDFNVYVSDAAMSSSFATNTFNS